MVPACLFDHLEFWFQNKFCYVFGITALLERPHGSKFKPLNQTVNLRWKKICLGAEKPAELNQTKNWKQQEMGRVVVV